MADSRSLACELWVEEHEVALYRFALRRVSDPERAADLVQETFLEGLRARASFSGNASVRTWLTAILKHKIVDAYRRSERMPRSDEQCRRIRAGHGGDAPDAILERSEFWEVPGRCVLRLPEPLAAAFVAIEFGDLGRDRTCEQLQITAANLAVRLYRARLLLRGCLETHGFASAAPRPRGRSA
jgi:RNA polymerase sigma-70 factor (ECF subfamily)